MDGLSTFSVDDDDDDEAPADKGSNNINVLLSKSAYKSVIAIPARVPAAIPASPPNILLPTVNPIAIFSTKRVVQNKSGCLGGEILFI